MQAWVENKVSGLSHREKSGRSKAKVAFTLSPGVVSCLRTPYLLVEGGPKSHYRVRIVSSTNPFFYCAQGDTHSSNTFVTNIITFVCKGASLIS